jgi:UDP-N-acetylmuramate dehydrogenase
MTLSQDRSPIVRTLVDNNPHGLPSAPAIDNLPLPAIELPLPADCTMRSAISLKGLTTWKVGGAAEWYLEPRTLAETQSGLIWAKTHDLPVTIIGAGSNLLISDRGLAGLVICTRHLRHVNTQFDRESRTIVADAGKMVASLSWQAARRGWSGMECWRTRTQYPRNFS